MYDDVKKLLVRYPLAAVGVLLVVASISANPVFEQVGFAFEVEDSMRNIGVIAGLVFVVTSVWRNRKPL